ncbi:MAG: hypothetical protein WBM41_20265 [Arenicellales bacterium]
MKFIQTSKRFFICALVVVLAGCASSVKTVPFKVQSDPLGAYVLYQIQADRNDTRNYDWIYLGNTPLDIRRAVLSRDLKRADAFVVRVMKEGYLDQQKAWTGEQIVKEAKKKGAVFWNPRLIPSTN